MEPITPRRLSTFLLIQHSWVRRLRDMFKKYRSRKGELVSSEEVQRMKSIFGRKRVHTAADEANNADERNEKIRRIQVYI